MRGIDLWLGINSSSFFLSFPLLRTTVTASMPWTPLVLYSSTISPFPFAEFFSAVMNSRLPLSIHRCGIHVGAVCSRSVARAVSLCLASCGDSLTGADLSELGKAQNRSIIRVASMGQTTSACAFDELRSNACIASKLYPFRQVLAEHDAIWHRHASLSVLRR